jgi:tripartite-type tricarboxylate transporter receptor subunit TctC
MTLPRRSLLATAALLPLPALAQRAWPSRPTRLICPFAPGGTTDIVARIVAEQLTIRLGQPVVVENRPGGGATVAAAQMVGAEPDGHTLFVSNSASHGISPTLFRNIGYDPMADFTHIALAATTSTAVLVHPRYEAQTLRALVELGRRRPDGLDFAISGAGTSTHLLGMRFASEAGIRLNPIPYRGSGPALIDVVAGTVGLMFDGLPSCIPLIREGRLNAIAVADPERNSFLPNVPTMIEQGFPGMTSYSWFGVSGPRNLPRPIVDRLSQEIRDILRMPAVRERWTNLTANAPDTTPEQYTEFVREELRVWGGVVQAVGLAGTGA